MTRQIVALIVISFYACVLLFSSCNVQYGVANFTTETSNIQKPFVTDSTEKTISISGGYHYSKRGYNDGFSYDKYDVNLDEINNGIIQENFKLYSFGFNRVVATPRYYYSYGLFGHVGEYHSGLLSLFEQDYSFKGVGYRGEFGMSRAIFNKRGNFKWGVKTTFLYEGGEYSNFRKEIADIYLGTNYFLPSPEVVNLNPNDISANVSINGDFAFKLKGHVLGAYANLGINPFLGPTLGFGGYYSYKRISAFYGMGRNLYANQSGAGIAWVLFKK